MLYQPPLDGDLANANRSYIDPNPAAGIAGSAVGAKCLEHSQREIIAAIEAAGIVPDEADLTQLAQAIQALIAAEVGGSPVSTDTGQIAYFSRSTAPTGWFKANGATVSRGTYSDLFAAIGTTFGAGDGTTTFKLPDLRGEFLRAIDDGRGLDAGRAFGSIQKGTIVGGDYDGGAAQTAGAVGTVNPNIGPSHIGADAITPSDYPNVYLATGINATQQTPAAHTNQFGVTRPRNMALLACIKY